MRENVYEMRHQIDELKKNIPKSVAKRMERDAKIRAEAELDTGEDKKNNCAVM